MRGRVLLLIILVLVVAGAVAAALFLQDGGPTPDGTAEPGTPSGTGDGGTDGGGPIPTPSGLQPVVIALQPLGRGLRLTSDLIFREQSAAVGIAYWPEDNIPANSFRAVEDVVDLLVRTDIPQESPVLSTQLAADYRSLGRVGSDAALLLRDGTVAVAMPLDPSGIGSVAYGLQQGDFVDVILSFLFIEVDETFQTRLPNHLTLITRDETGNLEFSDFVVGRAEPSPLSAVGVVIGPSETQRPRLLTQKTIQNAQVIHVGYFPPDGFILGQRTATPTPFDTSTPDPNVTQAPQGAPTIIPTPTPYVPLIVTLGMSSQDALVLVWAIDAQIPVTLALRAINSPDNSQTTAVTLQYLIDNYAIPQPPILPFALEPPINRLRTIQLDVFSGFGAEEPTPVP